MLVTGNFLFGVSAFMVCVTAQDYFLSKSLPNFTAVEPLDQKNANTSASFFSAQDWQDPRDDTRDDNMPCDVSEILGRGDSASYHIFQRHHKEYMSTNGYNVDLYHDVGSHAVWHLKHVAGHTANRFYLVNDWKNTYLHSSGNWNHDNVELVSWTWQDRDLQWLFFSAQEITTDAPKCTFYIMHSDSHKWLDTHGHNVHIWGDNSDLFEVGDSPENLQWELRPVRQ